MQLYSDVFKKLVDSIMGEDFIILCAAIATLIFAIFTIFFSEEIKKKIKKWKIHPEKGFAKSMNQWLSKSYSLFLTLISIFPLLGMLGTVCGLLGLDLSEGNMENVKVHFFIALTSTAWGIIFSVVFKLFHALFMDDVEKNIEESNKIIEEIEKIEKLKQEAKRQEKSQAIKVKEK